MAAGGGFTLTGESLGTRALTGVALVVLSSCIVTSEETEGASCCWDEESDGTAMAVAGTAGAEGGKCARCF